MAKNKGENSIAVISEETRTALAIPIRPGKNMGEMMLALTSHPDIADAISAGLEIEQRVKLSEGDMIRGPYRGRVATSFENAETGEVTPGWLHNFSVAPGIIAQVSGGYDLDKKLETYPIDADVFVLRGPQQDTRKGRRVNTWLVGKARSTAQVSTVDSSATVTVDAK